MANPELGFAIPVLPALDIEAAVAFYREKLGFEAVFQYPEYAGLARDGVQIHLWHCEDPVIPNSTSCRVQVTGVDGLHAELEPRGVVHPNGGLEDKPWGYREFTILDGCGNCIVFAEPQE